MEIKTRFNINDKVYHASPSGINESIIVGFAICSGKPIKLTDGTIFSVPTIIDYIIEGVGAINEKYLFASKKELLEYLNKD